MVADDSKMVRNTIRVELESGGYQILEAADGVEALILAAKEVPDLVTLDIEMPKLNGFETCRKLRGAHYSSFFKRKNNGRMPIIFVTGNDTIEGRNEGFQLGAADFILKPFAQGQVLSAVNNMLKPKKDLEGLTALAVDDSPVARHIITQTLKREGVTVFEAVDGLQAFEIICSRVSEIDIIITDMVMPRMNGVELCRKIREELNLSNLPVIFLTAASDQSQLIEVFNAGATDYLIKPFLKEELLARLNVQFEKIQLSKHHRSADVELAELQRMRENLSQICKNTPRSSLSDIVKAARFLSEKTADETESQGEFDRIQKSVEQIDDFLLEVSSLIAPATPGKRDVPEIEQIAEETQPETHGKEQASGYKILLAESNPVNLKLAERILKEAGHSVISVNNGPDALLAAERKNLDLLFLDTRLSGIDGMEITAAIRSLEREWNTHLPIIAMADQDDDTEKGRCVRAGMDDYISQPLSPSAFFDAIERQMLFSSMERPQPEEPLAEKNPKNSVILDKEELMERVGGEKELFDEIITLFLQDTPLQVKQLKDALENKDGETIYRQGHTLKGSAANIGAHALKDAASEMEKAGKSDDWDLMDKIYRKVVQELKMLEDFLNAT